MVRCQNTVEIVIQHSEPEVKQCLLRSSQAARCHHDRTGRRFLDYGPTQSGGAGIDADDSHHPSYTTAEGCLHFQGRRSYTGNRMARFLAVLFLVSSATVVVAFIWPRVMAGPRPAPLATVYQAVRSTKLGEDLGTVLGVASDSASPIDPTGEAQRLGTVLRDSAEAQIRQAVSRHAIIMLKNQFDRLPTETKEEIRNAFCVIPTTPAASSSSVSTGATGPRGP